MAEAIADVSAEPPLAPVLRRLLRDTGRLTGAVAGSVSLIDAGRGSYTKAAEFGGSCRLGHTFPLDEGATGRAYDLRRPVVIPDYGRLRAGHLAAAHPARHGPAAAVPIWWRGDVIAVSVAFAPRTGQFAAADVDRLEVLAQPAAALLIRAGGTLRTAPFTPREADVVELLRQGLTYREIAHRLALSPKTVDKHVGAIMRKTGASNRTSAVVTALTNDWLV